MFDYETYTVKEYKEISKADSYVTIRGKSLKSNNMLFFEDESPASYSPQYAEPVFPLKTIKVKNKTNARTILKEDPSIKYYKSKGERNWKPIQNIKKMENPRSLGKVLDMEWYKYCTSKYDDKKHEYNWPLYYGPNSIFKEGDSTTWYAPEEYFKTPIGTLIVSDNEYDHLIVEEDGCVFAFMYWVYLYKFNSIEEAQMLIDDIDSSKHYESIIVKYRGGKGNRKAWRTFDNWKQDIRSEWFPGHGIREDFVPECDSCLGKYEPEFNELVTLVFACV